MVAAYLEYLKIEWDICSSTIYNDDFLQNRTKDTCRQYACSDDPGAGDAWAEGHGGQGMIEEIYASYENEP